MSQVIGVLSGKGGVGKTTITANLGAALTNDFGKSVVVVDANLNSSHLGLHMGLYQDLPVTLREVLRKGLPVSYAVYVHPSTGVRIVPAALNSEGLLPTPQKLREIVDKLRKDYEIIVMDCPPGLGSEVVTAITALDSAIVVTTPDFPSVADALKTVQLLEKMRKEIIGIVINKKKGKGYELTAKEVESTCGISVIGTIPEDKRVPEAIAEGIPVTLLYPNSIASVEIKRVAASLIGMQYRPASVIERLVGGFLKSRSYGPARPAAPAPSPQPAVSPVLQAQKPVGTRTLSQRGVSDFLRREDFTEEMKEEIREELKRQIMQKVKERMSQ